jgi:phosphoribosylformimino-5-aminoimidazole carboxamide ribotide isomerase
MKVWVDAGVRNTLNAVALRQAGIARVVVGLETLAGPKELAAILEAVAAPSVVFSLDLKDSKPLGQANTWRSAEPLAIARQAYSLGVRSMILLDLARVGLGQGPGTESLCRKLRDAHGDLELVVGGGVRGADDLEVIADWGASAVLVASALHDGRIDLRSGRLRGPARRG